MNYDQIISENIDRLKKFKSPYNQVTGEGSTIIARTEVNIKELGKIFIPNLMIKENYWIKLLSDLGSFSEFASTLNISEGNINELIQAFLLIRYKYDFEFWAATCVQIKDKISSQDIPFLLNYPQRKLLSVFEQQRLSDQPIRVILLKARQWGGSTLTQIYMAWIQLVHKRAWNSIICAHLKDSASNIKGMYSKLLENYPQWIFNSQLKFKPYERTQNISIIQQTECRVTIGSAETPNSVRGTDAAMAHLSEIAFWPATKNKKPSDLVRSVVSTVSLIPYSMVVLESTANGEGDYFYTEYNLAKEGKSDKTAVFIPWFDIEMYQTEVKDYKSFIDNMDDYDWFLWESGASLESIAWYRMKRKEYQDHQDMMSEYPTDDVEAFSTSGERVFDKYRIELLKKKCCAPNYVGEIQSGSHRTKGKESLLNLNFKEDKTGKLFIWKKPEDDPISNRYVVTVDIGGRSSKADYSVIVVYDRYWMMYGGVPEVVAQWYGHIDHDLLVWKSAQIASYYNKALLVIESNTLETEDTDGEHTEYILETLNGIYPNLYSRTDPTKIKEGAPIRFGFHTNRSTKTMIIDHMVSILRDDPYIERDEGTCFEYNVFEKKQNGSFGAKEGKHDDRVMTRLIGIYVCYNIPLPKEIVNSPKIKHVKTISEATI